MKSFAELAFVALAMACTSGGSTASQQSSSESKSRNTPVAAGEVAPDFTLEDQNRNKVKLSEARGITPVVLVFYRGYW